MGWETDVFDLFEDLEAQADALWQAERAVELADRAQSEYANVTLAGRLMASVGGEIALDLPLVGRLAGRLSRVGQGWCLLGTTVAGTEQEWVVLLDQVSAVHGASPRSVPEVAWTGWHRLGVRSALRRLADARAECLVHLGAGGPHEGMVGRVGADFAEIRTRSGEDVLVPYRNLVAVQNRDG